MFYSITGVTVSQAAVQPHLAPSFGTPSLLCTLIERNLKGLDWEMGSYRMTSQVTRFDPFIFISMGYIKHLVYQTKVQDVAELRCRITAACETATTMML
jgi:hypothetical protein